MSRRRSPVMSPPTQRGPSRRGVAPALFLAATLAALAGAGSARAGTFILSDFIMDGEDIITHPTGYTGSGGTLTVSVCIDPGKPNAAAMVIPILNIIETWNDLVPTSPNLFFGANNNIPSSALDFESTALHELGHCIGLGHPNLSTESGLSDPDRNYTKALRGPNNAYDLGIGADLVRGSSDDARGDDVNLHWFRVANNNPFTIGPTVDATTYSRLVADLPGGHAFAANADRDVGALLGFPDTEAVMQQGQFTDEAQRDLNHDDVATLRLGMAGLDMIEGTADDYTVMLTYAGMTTSCDIVASFNNAASFASCATFISQVSGDHWAITSATMNFNTGFTWFFNQVPIGPTPTPTPTVTPTPTLSPTPVIDHYVLYKAKASTRSDLPLNGKFPPTGYNLKLDDATLANTEPDDPENYQVKKEKSLAVPAMKNAEAGRPLDPALHYVRYQIKEAAEGAGPFNVGAGAYPSAVKHKSRVWSLVNQFGTIKVVTKKVEAMLVPAAKSLVALPSPPPNATHYLCYQAKPTKAVTEQTPDTGGGAGKFRKDLEAYFGDQFLDVDCALDKNGNPSFPGSPVAGKCLFDLKKVKALCNPIEKSDVGGVPARFTIAPPGSSSTPVTTDSLLCYQAKLASKVLSASAAALGNVSLNATLAQRKHVKRTLSSGTAPHTQPGNQFPAPLQMDTTATELICVPTLVESIAAP
jgi:hypothetical protein